MRGSAGVLRPVLAMTIGLLLSMPVAAQLGRISGTVRTENGQPLKGATVVAENADATPPSFTAITDAKGRFSMIGLRNAVWHFTASAPGFVSSGGAGHVQSVGSNAPLEFRLVRRTAPQDRGVLAGVNASDIQAAIDGADAHMQAGRYDEAIAEYRAVLGKAPALTAINIQIGRAHRLKRDYDSAIALYQQWRASDPTNERAAIELGMTYLETGDAVRADATLSAAAQAPSAGTEVFFSLGEAKLAREMRDEATLYYKKAADADPSWAKPLLRLGLIAAYKGDRQGAARYLERVLVLQPTSDEASQARTVLDQLPK